LSHLSSQDKNFLKPTDRHITKFWPLEMLLAKYEAIVLRNDFMADISRVLGIEKRQRLQARKHALKNLRKISHQQRKEKMQKEWQRQLLALPPRYDSGLVAVI
jgi:hypothetical protein